MKVAWVSYAFSEYSALHVNALAEQHQILLVMPDEVGEEFLVSPKVQHLRFAKPRLRQPMRQLASLRKIVHEINMFQPDVIHLQQGHLWFNAILRKLKKYPLVVTIHDPRHHAGDASSQKTPQWVLDYGFRKASQVIVHGHALASQVQELFGFTPDRIHVIPHVAMGQHVNDSECEPENERLLLFFGRIWDYKGLEYLIAAAPLIAKHIPDVQIMIAGQGDDFRKYESLMQNRDQFIVHNQWISDEQRSRFFQRAAVVVLPYTEATQSGVVPVAANYSKPVVATRVGALMECVEHETTGLLVQPRDPEALAEAIVKLLSHPELRHEMGRAAKRKLELESTPAVVAKLTADVYSQAVLPVEV